jgi:hypothetical protein
MTLEVGASKNSLTALDQKDTTENPREVTRSYYTVSMNTEYTQGAGA